MCRRICLLARSVHMHVRRWHVGTVRVLSIVRWGCGRRGRVWGRHKYRTWIVCQHGRGGKVLTVRQRSRGWTVPHVIHVCTAAGQLVWRRAGFLRFAVFWWWRNRSWRGSLLEFSFVFCRFVQLSTFGSSIFEPNLKQNITKASHFHCSQFSHTSPSQATNTSGKDKGLGF